MADIYFFKGTTSQQELQIIFHMTTPVGNNNQGVPFASAVLMSGYSSGESLLPSGDGTNGTIDPAEREAISLGTRIEWVSTYSAATDGGTITLGNAQAKRTADIVKINAELSQLLNNFGFAGS